MKRDFVAELKSIIRKVDAPAPVRVPEMIVRRYNIHKRSLPASPKFDRVVVFDVTKEEAVWWLEHRLQPFVYLEEATETKRLIYYDIVPVNATDAERSIYYNDLPAQKVA